MPLLDTSGIPGWPPSIHLAYDQIQDHESTDFLSSEELKSLGVLANEQRKKEFMSGRKLFRDMVKELDWGDSSITIHKEDLGKPFGIKEGKRFFISFSHTRDMVFCAFSDQMDLGIDAEQSSRKVHEGLMKRILSEAEQVHLEKQTVIQLWTIKEAAVKRKGTGIRLDLKQVRVSDDKSVIFNDDSIYQFCNFEALGHSISLVY